MSYRPILIGIASVAVIILGFTVVRPSAQATGQRMKMPMSDEEYSTRWNQSEEKLEPELHLARRFGAKDPAEVRRPEDPVGSIEVGVIEQVEDLPA